MSEQFNQPGLNQVPDKNDIAKKKLQEFIESRRNLRIIRDEQGNEIRKVPDLASYLREALNPSSPDLILAREINDLMEQQRSKGEADGTEFFIGEKEDNMDTILDDNISDAKIKDHIDVKYLEKFIKESGMDYSVGERFDKLVERKIKYTDFHREQYFVSYPIEPYMLKLVSFFYENGHIHKDKVKEYCNHILDKYISKPEVLESIIEKEQEKKVDIENTYLYGGLIPLAEFLAENEIDYKLSSRILELISGYPKESLKAHDYLMDLSAKLEATQLMHKTIKNSRERGNNMINDLDQKIDS